MVLLALLVWGYLASALWKGKWWMGLLAYAPPVLGAVFAGAGRREQDNRSSQETA